MPSSLPTAAPRKRRRGWAGTATRSSTGSNAIRGRPAQTRAALRLREQRGGEVIAITAGPASARDAITRALAMGADRGIHLELADVNATDTLGMARLLADAVRPLACDVVLAGQTADDLETGQ